MAVNRLADSLSPYLRQHADNPVHWQPWDGEALRLAAREDKPILLSAGYAACHWCHVMAHESFEDAETAALMNRYFVNIKIDREERPDLDRIYQAAHYVFARRAGGWPLTMFLTPAGAPFFGGTYFPREAGRGMPSFKSVLERAAEAWRGRRGEIEEQNARILPFLRGLDSHPPSSGALDDAPAREAARIFSGMIDREEGGFRGAPKFPHPAEFAFCLETAESFLDAENLQAAKNLPIAENLQTAKSLPDTENLKTADNLQTAENLQTAGNSKTAENTGGELSDGVKLTLQKIAAGGLADHAGGGFFRYAVDERWAIPHFEKMLSDNGLLLALFADAARVFDAPEFAQAAERIAEWALREMRAAGGAFYASLDADSAGGEGAFYVWDGAEIKRLLPSEEYAVWEAHFGLLAGANFEGKHHLARRQTEAQTAAALNIPPQKCAARLAAARARLYAARAVRPRPATDDKILAGWNGLMIRGLARAGRILNRAEWITAAAAALDFIRREMNADGRLCGVWRGRRGGAAFLDDCAFVLDAALELLRADFRADTLQFAISIATQMRAHFEDAERGGFFFTPADGEKLIRRPKPADDEAAPSGNGIAARALPLLSYLTGDEQWARAGEKTVRAFYGSMQSRPAGAASLLSALRDYLAPPPIVLLRGDTAACRRWREKLPRGAAVFILSEDVSDLPAALQKPAPARGARGYVCAGFSCMPPADSLDELRAQLKTAAAQN